MFGTFSLDLAIIYVVLFVIVSPFYINFVTYKCIS